MTARIPLNSNEERCVCAVHLSGIAVPVIGVDVFATRCRVDAVQQAWLGLKRPYSSRSFLVCNSLLSDGRNERPGNTLVTFSAVLGLLG